MFPFAQPQKPELPPQLKAQMEPFIEYFEVKWKEITTHTALPFDFVDGQLPFEEHEHEFNVLPDQYLTANLKDGKRILMLGSMLGTFALYEIEQELTVPKTFDPSGKYTITNYQIHAPAAVWTSGLLKLNQMGKPDLFTFIDVFGYPQKEGKTNHNDRNIAKRIELIVETAHGRARKF